MTHYSNYPDFLNALVGFSDYARAEGLKIGLRDTVDTVVTSLAGIWKDEPYFYFALASLFCSNVEDRPIFDKIYSRYWQEKGSRIKNKTIYKNQSNLHKKSQSTLAMVGSGSGDTVKVFEAKTTAGANKLESLRKTDFALVGQVDDKILISLTEQLVREMSLRIRRKFKKGRKGLVDISNVIRKSVQDGGNFLTLKYREKKKEKFRMVILLDVSGSMDKYSFYLLRFILMLRVHFKNIEVFTFSTKLLRITDQIDQRNMDISLQMLSHQADHWSGGTRIGECLKNFNHNYGKRVLNGRSLTVILSDGLDTGEAPELERQLRRIKLRTKKLVWLNPLKGMVGYQPIQKGMKVALPQLDLFSSAHNLQSLLTLESIIANA